MSDHGALARLESVDLLAEAVLEAALAAAGAAAGGVVLLTSEGEELEVAAARGYSPEVLDRWRRVPLADNPLVAAVVASGEPLVLPDAAAATERFPELAERFRGHPAARAVVPLDVEGRVVGALTMTFPEGHELPPEAVATLRRVARSSSVALDRARLFAAERRARGEAEGARALLAAVVRQMPAGVAVAEAPSGRLLLGNAALERIWRRPFRASARLEDYGRDWVGFHPDGRRLQAGDWPLARALTTGREVGRMEVAIERGDGTRGVIDVGAAPVRDAAGELVAAVATFVDVTARHGARERTAFLAEAGERLARSLDVEELTGSLCRLAVPRFADWCAIDLLRAGRRVERVAVAHADPARASLARRLGAEQPPRLDDPVGPGAVMRTGEPELHSRVDDELLRRMAHDEAELAQVREVGPRSGMSVPLIARGAVLGAISLGTDASGRTFGPEDLKLVVDLCRRAALALDSAQLFAREHEAVEALQRTLLPAQLPRMEAVRCCARYLPAGSAVRVGGDWYDVVPLPGGRVGLAVGDVVGHGMGAAALMGQLRTALRAYALDGDAPGAVLARLNRLQRSLTRPDMATALYAVLDPAAGRLTWAAAGHPPLLVAPPDGPPALLTGGGGVPVGVQDETTYEEASAEVAPGTAIVLYTDGLVERRGESLDDGLERLRQAVSWAPQSLDDLCEYLLGALLPPGSRPDDVALCVVRLEGAPEPELALDVAPDPQALVDARARLRRWLAATGAGEAEAFELLVACGEACANVLRHAQGEAGFQLRAAQVEGAVELCVRDAGRWRAPDDDRRGRGMRLMAAFADAVEVRPADGATELVLRRRLRRGAG